MFDLVRIFFAFAVGAVLLCILVAGVVAFWPLLLILLFLY